MVDKLNIILIDDNAKLSFALEANLKDKFNAFNLRSLDPSDFKNVDSIEGIDLLIVNKKRICQVMEIEFFLKKISKSGVAVIFSNCLEKDILESRGVERALIFEGELKLLQILSFIADHFFVAGSGPGPQLDEYVPIKKHLLFSQTNFPCAIFLRLSASKFVKLFNEGDRVDVQSIDKYIKKGIGFCYVLRKDFYSKCDVIFSGALVNKELFKENSDYLEKTNEVIHEILKEFGVSRFVIEGASHAITQSIEEIKKVKGLASLIEKFEKNDSRFIYGHSYLTTAFSFQLIKFMNWNDERVLTKISMAAILHDLGFRNDKLALMEGLSRNEILKLPKNERDDILGHPTCLLPELTKMHGISDEVISIIKNHHEGIGEGSYPLKLYGSSLSHLECLFNIAHAFSVGLYSITFNSLKVPALVEKIAKEYSGGNYKTVSAIFAANFSK